MFNVKILADSVSPKGIRLTTMEVTSPRFLLPEENTHRMFSRNSASSRAIPVEKRIAGVEADPFIPEVFGKNTRGMKALENLDEENNVLAEKEWRDAMADAIRHARNLAKLGVHKQLANRVIEPYCWQTKIISATEWDNFFHLRNHKDAQPEIKKTASMMYDAMQASEPKYLNFGEWHLPLIYPEDVEELSGFMPQLSWWEIPDELWETLKLISAGRCARVSYLTHDGRKDYSADINLAQSLISSGHLSPLEHQARPLSPDLDGDDLYKSQGFVGNYRGWVQFRKEIPFEFDVLGHKNQ